jgi:hypothetical protein
MSRFLVRVELADRPGALGAVASRIGAVRGDVVSVEILDRRGGRALDDFLVDLPDGAVDLLRLEIEEVDGAVVEAVHPVHCAMGDARRDAYDGATALLTERSPQGALRLLAALARRELAADWSAVVDTGAVREPSGPHALVRDLAVFCADGPAPPAHRLSTLACDLRDSSRLPSAETAWASMAAWDLALVVGRPGRRFVQAERERLTALARLGESRWAELSHARPDREHPARVG